MEFTIREVDINPTIDTIWGDDRFFGEDVNVNVRNIDKLIHKWPNNNEGCIDEVDNVTHVDHERMLIALFSRTNDVLLEQIFFPSLGMPPEYILVGILREGNFMLFKWLLEKYIDRIVVFNDNRIIDSFISLLFRIDIEHTPREELAAIMFLINHYNSVQHFLLRKQEINENLSNMRKEWFMYYAEWECHPTFLIKLENFDIRESPNLALFLPTIARGGKYKKNIKKRELGKTGKRNTKRKPRYSKKTRRRR